MAYMCINIIYPRLRYRTYVDIRDYVVHAISGLLPMFMTQPEAPHQKKNILHRFVQPTAANATASMHAIV